jgi:TetR/AcrR family transcriptional repressor of nem operon
MSPGTRKSAGTGRASPPRRAAAAVSNGGRAKATSSKASPAKAGRADRPREEVKRETRDALLRAGLEEFLERGLDVPSLDAICARAGFTRGAFYVHFRDRDDLIVAVMETVLGDFLDAIVSSDGGGDDLEETVTRFVRILVAGNPVTGSAGSMRTHRLLDVCTRSTVIRERFLQMLAGAEARVTAAAEAGQEAGNVRRDLPPSEVAVMLVALSMGVVQMFELGVPLRLDALRAAVLGMLAPSRCG